MSEEEQLILANEAKSASDALMRRGVWLCHKNGGRTPVEFYSRVGALMRAGDTFDQAYQTLGGAIIWPARGR